MRSGTSFWWARANGVDADADDQESGGNFLGFAVVSTFAAIRGFAVQFGQQVQKATRRQGAQHAAQPSAGLGFGHALSSKRDDVVVVLTGTLAA
jgi:hypothetical protein